MIGWILMGLIILVLTLVLAGCFSDGPWGWFGGILIALGIWAVAVVLILAMLFARDLIERGI